ncbi:MAG: hypothetical protein EDM74_05370 [Armatimonadetes bacterium]|nr:MAG: hypothetical protein EDM74_05370 [Armatimonadota bacterium]
MFVRSCYQVFGKWSAFSKRLDFAFAFAVAIGAILLTGSGLAAPQGKGGGGGGGGGGGSTPPADPAIAYLVLGNKPSISVMNADGSRKTVVLQFKSQLITGISWSPDGTMLAFGGSFRLSDGILRQGIAVLDVAVVNGTPVGSNLRVIGSLPPYAKPTWALDGSYIAFGSDDKLYGISPNGGAPFVVAALPDFGGGSVSFSPDGARVAYNSYDGFGYFLRVLNLSDQSTYVVCPTSNDIRHIDWARNSDRIAMDPGGPVVQIVDALPNSTPETIATSSWFPTWSPDDSRILYTTGASDSIVIRNLITGTVTSTGAKGRQANWRRF